MLMISTEANRKRVFLCLCCGVFAQFSGTSLTGYYLHNILEDIGIDSPNYQNKLNGFILMVNMIEAWFWASMVDRFGRRPLFLVGSSIFGVLVRVLTENRSLLVACAAHLQPGLLLLPDSYRIPSRLHGVRASSP